MDVTYHYSKQPFAISQDSTDVSKSPYESEYSTRPVHKYLDKVHPRLSPHAKNIREPLRNLPELLRYQETGGTLSQSPCRTALLDPLCQDYLISKIAKHNILNSVIDRPYLHDPSFHEARLEPGHFYPSRIKFSPDGAFLLISCADAEGLLKDFCLVDWRGQAVHSWKENSVVNAVHKDVCWLDSKHFLVRVPEESEELPLFLQEAFPLIPRTDYIRLFDVRMLAQPVQIKRIPQTMRDFYTVAGSEGDSWLIGAGSDVTQVDPDPQGESLFTEGVSLTQLQFSNGILGPHQLYPEEPPVIPAFEVDDELLPFWLLTAESSLLPGSFTGDPPSLLLLKNIWEPQIGLPGWPKLRIIEGNSSTANSKPFGSSSREVVMKKPIPGLYAFLDLTPDPLGSGFLATAISLTPMAEPPRPDRDVAVYHHVYFSLKYAEHRTHYEMLPRAAVEEPVGPGPYRCHSCFAPNGLYALRSAGNELEVLTNGDVAQPFGASITDDLGAIHIKKRFIFGPVGSDEHTVLAAVVNPIDPLNVAVLLNTGNLHMLRPQW